VVAVSASVELSSSSFVFDRRISCSSLEEEVGKFSVSLIPVAKKEIRKFSVSLIPVERKKNEVK
jgi:hypothetical protein